MSILTGFKKVKNYILTSSGYQLLSRWTSSQTVEFDDGKTAQAKLGEINGIAKTYDDMKKATDNSMAASAKAVMEGFGNKLKKALYIDSFDPETGVLNTVSDK